MACFPGLAAAEENSGIQYETDVPTVPNGDSNIPSKKKGGTNPSDGSNAAANESNTPGGVSSGEDESETGGGATANQGNQGPGAGDGKAADGSKPAGGDVSGAQPIKTVNSATEQASDDGGSSPLVPILIAVAVLAAISIGAYYYRQRRQGPDSTVAPPAS